MLARVMLAGVPVADDSVAELAGIVRTAGADELAGRLERALDDEVKLLALSVDERAMILDALDDPPDQLVELRATLMREFEYRVREGLDLRRPTHSLYCPS